MKIVFTRAEAERILLAFANDFTKSPEPFTRVNTPYSFFPTNIEVCTEDDKEEDE